MSHGGKQSSSSKPRRISFSEDSKPSVPSSQQLRRISAGDASEDSSPSSPKAAKKVRRASTSQAITRSMKRSGTSSSERRASTGQLLGSEAALDNLVESEARRSKRRATIEQWKQAVPERKHGKVSFLRKAWSKARRSLLGLREPEGQDEFAETKELKGWNAARALAIGTGQALQDKHRVMELVRQAAEEAYHRHCVQKVILEELGESLRTSFANTTDEMDEGISDILSDLSQLKMIDLSDISESVSHALVNFADGKESLQQFRDELLSHLHALRNPVEQLGMTHSQIESLMEGIIAQVASVRRQLAEATQISAGSTFVVEWKPSSQRQSLRLPQLERMESVDEEGQTGQAGTMQRILADSELQASPSFGSARRQWHRLHHAGTFGAPREGVAGSWRESSTKSDSTFSAFHGMHLAKRMLRRMESCSGTALPGMPDTAPILPSSPSRSGTCSQSPAAAIEGEDSPRRSVGTDGEGYMDDFGEDCPDEVREQRMRRQRQQQLQQPRYDTRACAPQLQSSSRQRSARQSHGTASQRQLLAFQELDLLEQLGMQLQTVQEVNRMSWGNSWSPRMRPSSRLKVHGQGFPDTPGKSCKAQTQPHTGTEAQHYRTPLEVSQRSVTYAAIHAFPAILAAPMVEASERPLSAARPPSANVQAAAKSLSRAPYLKPLCSVASVENDDGLGLLSTSTRDLESLQTQDSSSRPASMEKSRVARRSSFENEAFSRLTGA